MRYIFISDIHGEYDKMIAALAKVNFNMNEDTLVSLGDPFDRGAQSYEVLEFLMACPNRILIWGNHDLRLKEILIDLDRVRSFDYENGVLETMKSFCGNHTLREISTALQIFKTDDNYRDRCQLLWKYFDECHFAIEFSDLIGTHGWIPVIIDYKKTEYDKWGYPLKQTYYKYYEDWRNSTLDCWVSATWSHSQILFDQKIFLPDKKLIIGHWHAWRLRIANSVQNKDAIDFSTFEYQNKLVAIDGCSSAAEGIVNAWVYESEDQPQFIDAQK